MTGLQSAYLKDSFGNNDSGRDQEACQDIAENKGGNEGDLKCWWKPREAKGQESS